MEIIAGIMPAADALKKIKASTGKTFYLSIDRPDSIYGYNVKLVKNDLVETLKKMAEENESVHLWEMSGDKVFVS